ncbi:GNAT family N-acetyltransferase [Halobacillus sp. Marseille-Q1614]|uniref:GNAT family N-acetyltransferase n=1 Tax=Halobacillus sp. Marseille-Q1614 TaxID=2709134 RepID=UPI0015706F8E|nr:GNAT family N-acetyltransferase [Halobacillus sp. Marseille-Q1614]
MKREEILQLYNEELRVNAQTNGYRRELTDYVVRHVSLMNDEGFILFSNFTPENAKEIIEGEVRYFEKLGQRFEWKVHSYDQPDNLVDLLVEEGFERGEEEALMIHELKEDSELLQKEMSGKLVEITTEKEIADVVSLLNDTWGNSHAELGKRLWSDKRNNPECLHIYGIYEDDKLVSAAWMYFEANSSFASLWGGATRPDYRRKGYYTSLLAARAQKANEEGYRFLTVDSLEMSRPILEKSGFECLAYTYGCLSPK